MKKVFTAALLGIIIFIEFGTCAWCAQKKTSETYITRDTRGVRTSYSKVYYSGDKVVRIDTYDTRGVRKNTTKKD